VPHEQSIATVADVTCTACGCVCDDLTLTIERGRIVALSPGCRLAERRILNTVLHASVPAAINGQVASLDAAVERAARLLRAAHAPLIYGLSRSSTPGQRAAIRLADRLGACIDTTASTCHAPSIMALQAAGESTCTLGEIRSRSDLVIYWGSNPVISHPRHMERFVEAPGEFTPGGRGDRHVVVVDVRPTESAARADSFVQVDPGGDYDLLWALRGLVCGIPLQAESVAGVPREQIEILARRMMESRYGAVFFGLGLARYGVPHLNVEALLRLVTDLHRHTRFVARRMRIPGDVAGADSVLCWQTGYPFSVNLNRSYPRFNPGEFTANDLLRRQEIDVAVLVGSEGVDKLSTAAQQALQAIPCIVLDHPGARRVVDAAVSFTTAIYGIHRAGAVYRMDEVPIPLRPVIPSSLPADHDVLTQITEALDP
jgi:formylmethanofuran dehydrogenase subunit B